jgi:hypothetical protein
MVAAIPAVSKLVNMYMSIVAEYNSTTGSIEKYAVL